MTNSIRKLALSATAGVFCVSAIFSVGVSAGVSVAHAADMVSTDVLDPTPVAMQGSGDAVDGYNFQAGFVGGSMDGNSLAMFQGSMAMPMPFIPNFGIQADAAIGHYGADFNDENYTGAAAGLHIFWRDPSLGAFGIYGDWGYVDPEHSGRVAFEGAIYNDRWSLDALAGVQFGQHVDTRFVDEVDLSYYFTDNIKASIGHRKLSRGHVANGGFEVSFDEKPGFEGWSVFGEAEAGEDDYWGVWGGVRYAFGTGSAAKSSLIERDRKGYVKNRLPRIISSVTQCGKLANSRPKTSWRAEMTTLCSSKDELRDSSATIGKLD